MITLAELNPHNFPLTKEVEQNLQVLLTKLNKIRAAYGKPMVVTSGYRSLEDHVRIYREKAEKEGKPFNEKKVPKGSRHLFGMACDFADKDAALYNWCRQNEKILEEVGIWCEERMGPWLHMQSSPPRSGRRFFLP